MLHSSLIPMPPGSLGNGMRLTGVWVESTCVFSIPVGSFLLVWHLVVLQSLLHICGCIKSGFSQSVVFWSVSFIPALCLEK